MTLYDIVLKNKRDQIYSLKELCVSTYKNMELNLTNQINTRQNLFNNTSSEDEKDWLAQNYEEDMVSYQYPVYKMLESFFVLIISTLEKQMGNKNDLEIKQIYKDIGIAEYDKLVNAIKHGFGYSFNYLVKNNNTEYIKIRNDLSNSYCSDKFDQLYSTTKEPILNYKIEHFIDLIGKIDKYYDKLILEEAREEFSR